MDNNTKTGHRKTHGSAVHFTGNLLPLKLWCGVLALIVFSAARLHSETVFPEIALNSDGKYIHISSSFQESSFPAGYPKLPVFRKVVRGECSSFKTEIIREETVKLALPLYPKQPPVPKSSMQQPFEFNDRIYRADSSLLPVPGILSKKGEVTTIEIYPVDYIPSENILIKRTIMFTYVSSSSVKASAEGCLMIYADRYSYAADRIQMMLNIRGTSVKAVSASSAGASNAAIQSYIRSEYYSSPFRFLLLVGTPSDIPYFIGEGSDAPYTDLNYSLMDTSDYFPDVALSRIPAADSSELNSYLNNIMKAYENGRQGYFKKNYFMASDDYNYHAVSESTHAYSMKVLRSRGMYADSLFYYYSSGTGISDAVNSGRGYAYYSGHGSAFGWGGPVFSEADIANLTNSTEYPYIFSFACLTGNYFFDGFYGGAWLKYSDRGAIGFFGSSEETFWEEDDILQRALIDSSCSGVFIQEAVNKAKAAYYEHYGDNSTTRRYFESYNTFALPDEYYGNFSVSSHTFKTDRYEPASKGAVEFDIGWSGEADVKPHISVFNGYSLFAYADIDSAGWMSASFAPSFPGETLQVFSYIHNNSLISDTVILIDSGPYVAYRSINLSDCRADTFLFDEEIKNFGDNFSDSAETFIAYCSDAFTPFKSVNRTGSMQSESSEVFTDGLILIANGLYSPSEENACTLGVASGGDTTYFTLLLDNITPSFSVDFEYTVHNNDTLDAVVTGCNSDMHLKIKNNAMIKVRDIECRIVSTDIVSPSGIISIDSMLPSASEEIIFPVYAYSGISQSVSFGLEIVLGSYMDTVYVNAPAMLRSGSMYYGPVNGYYIYSSEMTSLKNAPSTVEYSIEEGTWEKMYVKDDTTITLELPFKFNFMTGTYDKVYLNTNGIISMGQNSGLLYQVAPLPAAEITHPSFAIAWQDFAPVYEQDDENCIFTSFDEERYSYVILYNNVHDLKGNSYRFAVALDTADLNVYFYDLPSESVRFVTGIQFNQYTALSFTGDSFFDDSGNPMIKEGMTLRYSRHIPELYGKYSLDTESFGEKLSFSKTSLLGSDGRILYTVRSNGYYRIDIYDITGRRVGGEDESFTGRGDYGLSISHLKSGVYFAVASEKGKRISSRRITLLK